MERVSAAGGLLFAEGVREFSLRATLESGQCFRYRELPDGFFEVRAGSRRGEFCLRGETLICRSVLATDFEAFWRNYFDLDFDYAAVREVLGQDPVLAEAMKRCGGLHILRQEPFETLVTFIISQNNNIPRIKGIVARLCEAYGEGGFPSPERLAALDIPDLACLRAGFRAKYILDAARKVTTGEVNLSALPTLPYDEAEAELRKISGVGEKVAACVLLFGARQLDTFPVDVWMKKAVGHFYPEGLDRSRFGGFAGIAQQYLYHYARISGLHLA